MTIVRMHLLTSCDTGLGHRRARQPQSAGPQPACAGCATRRLRRSAHFRATLKRSETSLGFLISRAARKIDMLLTRQSMVLGANSIAPEEVTAEG